MKTFHAHIYFKRIGLGPAYDLFRKINKEVGPAKIYNRTVGPHPLPMIEVVFEETYFESVHSWLALNRAGHSILIHAETGDDVKDHRAGDWLGECLELDYEFFEMIKTNPELMIHKPGPESIKVLFLDFDGVLNSAQFAHLQYRHWMADHSNPRPYREDFCPIACSNLLWILEEVPELKLVVSSSWRLGTPMTELKAILHRQGIPPELVIDKTPDLYKDKRELPRGLEIQKWLDDNKALNVEKFCIVDDDSDMEHLTETHFVKTSSMVGMDWFVARDIIRRLGDRETVEKLNERTYAI